MNSDFYTSAEQSIREACPHAQILKNELMSRHTSFRIGGPAPLLIIPDTPDALAECVRIFHGLSLNPLLIGNGSNLLIEDSTLNFPVICTHTGNEVPELLPGSRIKASAGITLAKLACFARDHGLTGLEFAHGIPGSLGGAVYMNAGAYGGEMAHVVDETTALLDGSCVSVCREEHNFSYRHSVFTDNGAVVLSSVLSLQPGDVAEISARMDDLSARRRASQPLEYPSAGSAFKRPEGAYAAALIDSCGLKGFGIGGARVSEKHAGFIINGGNASCCDVIAVIEHVRETVLRETGYTLEPEIRIIRADNPTPVSL